MSRSLYSAFRCPSSALHSGKHVRHRSCNHLRGAFYWTDLYLFAGPNFSLGWNCSTRAHWTATDRRNDYRRRRRSNRALVRFHIRSDRERHASALRSATPTRYRRTVSLVRNPMYIGATLGLAGTAIFYHSLSLSIYAGAFLLAAHLFVVFYEEPTLRKSFGADYEAYCQRIRRWVPGRTRLFHLKINR